MDVNGGATGRDVARLAGVSQPTVSRALRGDARVAEQTRQRILEAVTALGYVPSQIGRSLSTRATSTIGVVFSDLTNPFYPHLVKPLHDELERNGYRTVLFAEADGNITALERLIDRSLDGVVLTTTVSGSTLPDELLRRSIPFVFLNRVIDGIPADACVVDNRLGARLVAEEFLRLGHRRIGAVFGPKDTSTGREREQGFREVLSENGTPLPLSRTRYGQFAFQAGRDALPDLMDQKQRPTAVFCGNDVIALGAYNAAAALGIKIPDDLTIIGFDDIALAAWDVFNLTTIRTDLARMAATAGQMLVRRIATPGTPPQRLVLPPELILRGTHGPPNKPG